MKNRSILGGASRIYCGKKSLMACAIDLSGNDRKGARDA